MSEENPASNAEDGQNDNSMAAFSPLMKELEDALNMLYIKNNASGRNKFRDKWPFVAQHLFGETLIDYDNHGPKDREHRAELEERADERRLLLKVTISEVINKSVKAGMLNFEYAGKVIDTFGAELSKFLYAENIIERVRPGLMSQTKSADHQKDQSTQATQPPYTPIQTSPHDEKPEEDIDTRVQEKEILRNQNTHEDKMDHIKPIDTGNPAPLIKEDIKNIESPPSETENDFTIPETLETSPEQSGDETATMASNEVSSTPYEPPIRKEEEHAPITEQSEEPKVTESSEIPAEMKAPEQPHIPKIEKGFCTSIFNTYAKKTSA